MTLNTPPKSSIRSCLHELFILWKKGRNVYNQTETITQMKHLPPSKQTSRLVAKVSAASSMGPGEPFGVGRGQYLGNHGWATKKKNFLGEKQFLWFDLVCLKLFLSRKVPIWEYTIFTNNKSMVCKKVGWPFSRALSLTYWGTSNVLSYSAFVFVCSLGMHSLPLV